MHVRCMKADLGEHYLTIGAIRQEIDGLCQEMGTLQCMENLHLTVDYHRHDKEMWKRRTLDLSVLLVILGLIVIGCLVTSVPRAPSVDVVGGDVGVLVGGTSRGSRGTTCWSKYCFE